jgi:hypothetical protein
MTPEDKSSDGYVRIPTSALHTVPLRHLLAEEDPSIGVTDDATEATTITGITEWTGSWNGSTVSVGWDWGIVRNVVVLVNPNEIRTNIQLVGRDGQPEPPAIAAIHLMHWIETLSWQRVVIDHLFSDDRLQ